MTIHSASCLVDEKYRIVSELGSGGMGIVYEAVHLGLGHRVAIKFLGEGSVRDDAALARFAREARAGANIASEHVARVFDIGMTENDVPYPVMELLEGDDLGNVLEHYKMLRIEDAVRFALQATAALSEAHAIGIVHRDLKPENVFLQARRGAPPVVKILDFGLAKIRAQVDAAQTETEVIFGTPKYMAPEQLKSTAHAGPEADVWALGVLLYQMVGGRRPFDGPIVSVIIADILTKDAQPLRELRPDVPAALEAAIAQCMSREPRERPTAPELASMLAPFAPAGCDELAARIKATERTDSEVERTRVKALATRRRPRLRLNDVLLLCAICAALFLAGLALSIRRTHKARGISTATTVPALVVR